MAKRAARQMVDCRKRNREGLRQATWLPDWTDPELLRRLRKDAELLRDHPSTKEGDEFVEAALRDLEAELDELENRKD